MRRLSVCVALVVALVAVAGTATASLGDARPAGSSPPAGPSPRFPVGIRVLPFEDTTRATPADPEGQTPVAASATRALPTTVLYPAADGTPGSDPTDDARARRGRFPLLLFSHGTPGTPADYLPLLETWAAAGYVVAAPLFPVSSLAGPDPVTSADQRDQVRDARFALDRVLELNKVPTRRGGLGGVIDPSRIGVAGHSLGGLTTLALVSDCCRDRRIDAAVVLAGVRDNDAEPAIRGVRGPILFAHASRDYSVRFSESEEGFREASAPKYFLEIRIPFGAVSHFLPFTPGGPLKVANAVARVTDAFLRRYLDDDGGGGPGQIRRAAAADEALVLRSKA